MDTEHARDFQLSLVAYFLHKWESSSFHFIIKYYFFLSALSTRIILLIFESHFTKFKVSPVTQIFTKYSSMAHEAISLQIMQYF